jgi:hypothetical protein
MSIFQRVLNRVPKQQISPNPYAAEVHAKLAEPGDILIIGTGLTSLDLLLTLDKTKREAPDPLRIGAYTAEGGYICNREGQVISGLYTLGSTQKGRLYESVAVPELRRTFGRGHKNREHQRLAL